MHKTIVYIPNMGTLRTELIQVLMSWEGVEIVMPQGIIPIDNARNYCVADFIKRTENDDDRMVFIDSDIIPKTDTIQRLNNWNVDIVGTLCLVLKPDDDGVLTPVPMALRKNDRNEYKVFFDGKALTEVDATGSGCIMIKRKVFEAIEGKKYEFKSDEFGNLTQPEDFSFCEKAKAKGFKVHVDYGILCGHVKEMNLNEINRLLIKNHD